MKKISMALVFFLCLGSIVFVRNSEATYYKYVDANGTVAFSNNLQTVPEQYRSSVVIVKDPDAANNNAKTISPVAGSIDTKTASSTSETKAEAKRPLPLSTRLLISASICFGVFLVFVLISKQPEIKNNKGALTIVRASLLGLVSLYLVIAHVGDVMAVFGAAAKAIESVKHHSEEKGKKAGQAIKKMNAMFEDMQKSQAAMDAPSEPAAEEQQ